MEIHDMIYMGKTAEALHEFECPVCAYHMIMSFDPYEKVILNQGDFIANHRGGIGSVFLDAKLNME